MSKTTIIMSSPEEFRVEYEINPWMHADRPIDTESAKQEWHSLKATYEKLGAKVITLAADHKLPDLVFATDGAITIGQKTMLANFHYAERAGETAHHQQWAESAGQNIAQAKHNLEGGDILKWRGFLFMGYGFRSQPEAADELRDFFGCQVISLELVDPRFYHLDTALAVVSPDVLAYYPPAFSPASQKTLRELPVNLVEATEDDALAFGLNSYTLGGQVLMSPTAKHLGRLYTHYGLKVMPVDTHEFQKSGGGIKCLSNIVY